MSVVFHNFVFSKKIDTAPSEDEVFEYANNYVQALSEDSYNCENLEIVKTYQVDKKSNQSSFLNLDSDTNLVGIYFNKVENIKFEENVGKVCFAYGNKIEDKLLYQGPKNIVPEETYFVLFPRWIDIVFYPLDQYQELVIDVFEIKTDITSKRN